MHPYICCGIICSGRDGAAIQVSIGRGINTMEYYVAIKQDDILPSVTTWMDLEGMMLSDISQTETQIPYHFHQ